MKIFSVNFLSRDNDYIEHICMATFTILAEIYSIKYFCDTKVPGLGEIFAQQKFSVIWYISSVKGGATQTRVEVKNTHCMVSTAEVS